MAEEGRLGTQTPSSPVLEALAPHLRAAGLKVESQTQEWLQYLNSLLAPDVVQYLTGMVYGPQSKYVTVHLDPQQFPSVELLHVTDVQFGHVECRYHRVTEYRDWVLSKPNRFMLWGGDMLDAYAAWSPGSAWENLFNPQSQVFRFVEAWAPVRHRILGFVGGNHERRAIPAFGDLGILIASLLQVPYSAGQQFIDIHYGKHAPFKTHLWHGRGAARTDGGKMQMLTNWMKEYPGSQLYLVGHLHSAMSVFKFYPVRKPGHNNVSMQKTCGAMSSSFLSTFGCYAEVAGMAASDVMMSRVILEPDGGWETTFR